MTCKKLTAIILSVLMIMTVTACKNDEPTDEITETTHDEIYEEVVVDIVPEKSTTLLSVENETSEVPTVLTSDTLETDSDSVKDLSQWTKAEIVEAYKNAAIKSHSSVISRHAVEITKISVNGEELGKAFDFVKKIISSFISDNSEDSNGITGGYRNLTEADVSNAKIYKDGKNAVIEMVMKNQTDGAKADVQGGSVGHAIDVVGDISMVTAELTELGLPIEIPSESTSIHYTNPVVKVLVDENGKIIKGTWRYTVEIRLKDYKVFGADVQSSSIVMDNVITVNGGF